MSEGKQLVRHSYEFYVVTGELVSYLDTSGHVKLTHTERIIILSVWITLKRNCMSGSCQDGQSMKQGFQVSIVIAIYIYVHVLISCKIDNQMGAA
jgi:hypothetical protein